MTTCIFWLRGGCNKKACPFLHELSEQKQQNQLLATADDRAAGISNAVVAAAKYHHPSSSSPDHTVCHFFVRGGSFCKNGVMCHFVHPQQQMIPPQQVWSTCTTGGGGTTTSSSSGGSSGRLGLEEGKQLFDDSFPSSSPPPPQQPCRFFLIGNCNKAEHCKFSHTSSNDNLLLVPTGGEDQEEYEEELTPEEAGATPNVFSFTKEETVRMEEAVLSFTIQVHWRPL